MLHAHLEMNVMVRWVVFDEKVESHDFSRNVNNKKAMQILLPVMHINIYNCFCILHVHTQWMWIWNLTISVGSNETKRKIDSTKCRHSTHLNRCWAIVWNKWAKQKKKLANKSWLCVNQAVKLSKTEKKQSYKNIVEMSKVKRFFAKASNR